MTSLDDSEAPNANPRDADLLLAEGFKIIDFGGGTYIGHVAEHDPTSHLGADKVHNNDTQQQQQQSYADADDDANGVGAPPKRVLVPHGFGYLLLADLSQHIGEFRNGRAHGPGVLLRADGSEREGEWSLNARSGEFRMTKADGTRWTERYDIETGKIKARKRRPAEEDPTGDPAVTCWTCGGHFRREGLSDNPYACRSHRGTFHKKQAADRDDENPEQPGVWTCCSRPKRGAPGCKFDQHNLNH
jgi:hypothetical protein